MKLNSLPTRPDEKSAEVKIINERLNGLFSSLSDKHRQVALSSKGQWLDDRRHVKLDSVRGISSHLLSYSTEFKYDCLEPFEALYCLESHQLLIFRNGVPLSLAEAYQLILNDNYRFRNYRVFQQLNRSGYVCLQTTVAANKYHKSKQKEETDIAECSSSSSANLEPLFYLDAIQLPSIEVTTRLQQLGPKEQLELPDEEQHGVLEATFEVYKRETYSKKKPRKGNLGEPDYMLVVCDSSQLKRPTSKQLLHLTSKQIMFALIDDDYSVCFAQFSVA